ncbi:MAG TPA: TonB family protein [Puia sp.]|nr:TonB family protein [Puia sp.]
MEPNQIKEAHILDILFDGRNKEYGAYELRKTYNRRMVKSMLVMGSVVVLVLLGGVVSGLGKKKGLARVDVGGDVIIQSVVDPPPPPPPPPPRVPQQQVATRIFTPPLIVKEDVRPEEKPPVNDDLINVKIGTVNHDGDGDADIVGPPMGNAGEANVVVAPKKEDDGGRFIPIEKEAEFPGGPEAWARFLNKTLSYPSDAVDRRIEGTVIVQFVVDADGNVSDVKAVSGPEEGGLREEAVRVIKKSGKWVPALQNGRSVRAYRRQPVVFRTVDEN